MLIPFSICECANENGAVLLVVLLPRKRIQICQLHIVILDIRSLPMYKKYRKGKFTVGDKYKQYLKYYYFFTAC